MRRILSCFILLFCFLACFASPVAAHAQHLRGDAFFGYSRTGNDTFYSHTGGLNGWEADLHVRMRPFLGFEGDVAHYGLGADSFVPRTTTVLFGPRVTAGTAHIRVFAHALFGGQHSGSDRGYSGGSFAYALGGGLDVPVAPFFAWRFEGDRISAPTQSPGDGSPARFTTGLVFRF